MKDTEFFPEDDDLPGYGSAGASTSTPTGAHAGVIDMFDAVPVPAGILRAYVKQAKKLPGKAATVVIEVQPDEGVFASGSPVSAWFDLTQSRDVVRLKTWAGVLGVTIHEQAGGKFGFDWTEFAKRPCRALFVPWHKDDGSIEPQIAKWAPNPDPNHGGYSPEFDEWAKANSFSYETIKGTSGIMPL